MNETHTDMYTDRARGMLRHAKGSTHKLFVIPGNPQYGNGGGEGGKGVGGTGGGRGGGGGLGGAGGGGGLGGVGGGGGTLLATASLASTSRRADSTDAEEAHSTMAILLTVAGGHGIAGSAPKRILRFVLPLVALR